MMPHVAAFSPRRVRREGHARREGGREGRSTTRYTGKRVPPDLRAQLGAELLR